MATGSKRVVYAALAGNAGIALAKFVAAFVTGSPSTLSEAVHSVADTGNQALLLVGLSLSRRPASIKHPFGRSRESYFWPLIVAVMLFVVGGVVAFYEGSHTLRHLGRENRAHHGSAAWSLGVLLFSFALEAYSFSVAYREFKKTSRGQRWLRVIRESRDPTIPTVLLEDSAALLGLVLALLGVGLSAWTGTRLFDALGSLLIGTVLCGVAGLLAYETHGLLIGEGITEADRRGVVEILNAADEVIEVREILSMHHGPEDVILALKLAFKRGMPVDRIEATIDELEARIRARLPHMTKIFIEPDSAGGDRKTVL